MISLNQLNYLEKSSSHSIQQDLNSELSINNICYKLNESQKWYILKRLHFDNLLNLNNLSPEIKFIFDKIENIKFQESIVILKKL